MSRDDIAVLCEELSRAKNTAPRRIIWDGEMNFVAGVTDESTTSIEWSHNATGTTTIDIPAGAPEFTAVYDALNAPTGKALIFTADPVMSTPEQRWSGMLDKHTLTLQDDGTLVLSLIFLNDFEYIRRCVVPSIISILPTWWPLQPEARILIGPDSWLVGFIIGIALRSGLAGHTAIWQEFRRLFNSERPSATAFSIVDAFTEWITFSSSKYTVRAPGILESIAAGGHWRAVEAEYNTAADILDSILRFDSVTVTVSRYIDGDTLAPKESHLRHGALIVTVVKKPTPEVVTRPGPPAASPGEPERSSIVTNAINSVFFTGRDLVVSVASLFVKTDSSTGAGVQVSRNYSGDPTELTNAPTTASVYPSVVFGINFSTPELESFSIEKSIPKAASVYTKGNLNTPIDLVFSLIRLVVDTAGQVIGYLPLGTLITDFLSPIAARLINPHPRFSFIERQDAYSTSLYPTTYFSDDAMMFSLQMLRNRVKAYQETAESTSHEFAVSDTRFYPFHHFFLGDVTGAEVNRTSYSPLQGYIWVGVVNSITWTSESYSYTASMKSDSSRRGWDYDMHIVSQVNTLTRAVKRANYL